MAAAEPTVSSGTEGEMSLRVKTINDENYNLMVAPEMLISELKQKIKVLVQQRALVSSSYTSQHFGTHIFI